MQITQMDYGNICMHQYAPFVVTKIGGRGGDVHAWQFPHGCLAPLIQPSNWYRIQNFCTMLKWPSSMAPH